MGVLCFACQRSGRNERLWEALLQHYRVHTLRESKWIHEASNALPTLWLEDLFREKDRYSGSLEAVRSSAAILRSPEADHHLFLWLE